MDKKCKKIGILTSGGDAAGMNYAVVSVARCAARYGIELVGIKYGYCGIIGPITNLRGNSVKIDVNTALDMEAMRGTWLCTARCDEFKQPEVRAQAAKNLKDEGFDALVVVGGDGSFTGAKFLTELGIPCVGIPATIDNDLGYTEYSLGFNTAVGVCVDVVRSVRATSRSHGRPHVVEVMGRYCGEIALETAKATGAEILIVPEVKWTLDGVANRLKELMSTGNNRATVVIAEHSWEGGNLEATDWVGEMNAWYAENKPEKHIPEGEDFDSHRLAQILEMKTGAAVRHTVVGYSQRGAQCSNLDGSTAFMCGYRAVELLANPPQDRITSRAIGIRNGKIFDMDFAEALAKKKEIDLNMVAQINSL